MSSVFSKIFGGGSGEGKPSSATPGSGGQPSASNLSGGGSGNMMVPGDKQQQQSSQQQQPQQAQDPLAPFATIFDNGGKNDKKQPPQFKLSPEVLKQATDSLDFSSHVTPEHLEKFKNGDFSELGNVFNSVGRQAYQHAMEHNSALTDRFVSLRADHDRSGYGTEVSRTLAKQSLKSIAAKSPATAKFMEQLQAEIFQSNPDATPEFVDEQVRKGIMSMAGIIDPEAFVAGQKKPNAKSDGTVGDTDWDAWSKNKPAGS